MEDYRTMNRANWAAVHAVAPEYGLDRFRSDPDFLSGVVAFDRPLLWNHGLGDVIGALLAAGMESPAWSSTRACPTRLYPAR